MRSSEFLLEAISLSKYKIKTQQAIGNSVLETLYGLSEDLDGQDFDPAREASEDTFYGIMRPLLEEYFQIHLLRYLEDKLSTLAREIVGTVGNIDKRGSWVNAKFDNIGSDLGQALDDNTIVLSNSAYFDPLVKMLAEQLLDLSVDWYYGDDKRIESIKDLLENLPKNKRLQASIITHGQYKLPNRGYETGMALINRLAGTFIHECVHVAQQLPQQRKKRSETEYRSYLSKSPEEFYKSFEKQNGQYVNTALMHRLHAGSPQEIAAFAHNLALEIIHELNWDDADLYPQDIERVDYLHLLGKVKDHIVDRGIVPRTPREIQVFRRYIKLVYQEIDRYRDYLINKLKQQQTTK
jgi:hypothetical protein